MLSFIIYVGSFKDTLTIEIPKFDLVEDFIKFVENYSNNLVGKNIFKILVKE